MKLTEIKEIPELLDYISSIKAEEIGWHGKRKFRSVRDMNSYSMTELVQVIYDCYSKKYFFGSCFTQKDLTQFSTIISTLQVRNSESYAKLNSSSFLKKIAHFFASFFGKKLELPSLCKASDAKNVLMGIATRIARISRIGTTIATFPNPFKPLPGEPSFYKGITLSMQQGREEFRRLLIDQTKENYHLFSAENLREIAKTNIQLYLFLTSKIVGHVCNLKGPIPQQNEYPIEGFNEAFTIPAICSSFEKFAKSYPHLISLENAREVIHTLTHSIHSETVTDLEMENFVRQITSGNLNTPLVVNAGYIGHSAPLVFYKNSIYSCNRGALSIRGKSGIVKLTVERKVFVTKKLVQRLFKRMTVESKAFEEIQQTLLSLSSRKILYQECSPQKTGNCTFVNVALTLVVLIAIKKNSSIPEAKSIYKAWKKFLRQDLMDNLRKDYTYFQTNRGVQATISNLAFDVMNTLGGTVRMKRHFLTHQEV